MKLHFQAQSKKRETITYQLADHESSKITRPELYPYESPQNATTLPKAYSQCHNDHFDTKITIFRDGSNSGPENGKMGPAPKTSKFSLKNRSKIVPQVHQIRN